MEGPPSRPERAREHLVAAAVRYRGQTFTGSSHKEARRQMQPFMEAQHPELQQRTSGDFETFEDIIFQEFHTFAYEAGFVSNSSKFYDRMAASRVADKAGQLKTSYQFGAPLTSEDINWSLYSS